MNGNFNEQIRHNIEIFLDEIFWKIDHGYIHMPNEFNFRMFLENTFEEYIYRLFEK